MELEQPLGDSAATTAPAAVAPAATTGDAPEILFDEATGLPLAQQEPVEDEVEEELEGVKLKGKKEDVERVKAERLMQADYTRKTQSAADEKRAAEAERVQYQQAARVQQAFAEEIADIRAIDRDLAQFQSVNWQAWAEQDHAAASKAHMAFTQLQTRRGQLVGAATQKDQQLRQFAERETAKRVNDAEQAVMREVKDWSPKKYQEMLEFGKSKGIEPEALRQLLIVMPQAASVIDTALQHDRLLKQRVAKPPAAPAPPATRLSGTAAVSTKEPSQMSDREFAAWRKRQIAQRRP